MGKQFSCGPFPHRREQRPHTLLESVAHGGVDPSLEAQGPKYCEPGAEDPALQFRVFSDGSSDHSVLSSSVCSLHTLASHRHGKGDPFLKVMMSLESSPD